MKILFMGESELGKLTLERLILNRWDVIGAVCTITEDRWYYGVEEIAKEYEIPLFKTDNINQQKFIEQVKLLKPDIIVVANFQQILRKDIINIPTICCINAHASLLPKYRGRAPINWAIISGEKETGVTVHNIDEGIDSGSIIKQIKIKISQNDYVENIMEKVKEIYPRLIEEALELIKYNKVEPVVQNKNESTYFGKRTPRDGQINWELPVEKIYNLIRAISKPYPGGYTYYGNDKVIIWRAYPIIQNFNQKISNGTISEIDGDGSITVKCMDGLLKISEFEFKNGSDMEVGRNFRFMSD